MSVNTDPQKIEQLLTRGVENVYPNKEFLEELLKSGKKLKLYLGIDPTGPSLHLGHAISLMKLRQFQELGHTVIMLIGSFTAMIGDPTDKLAVRQPLTRKQVLANCKNYEKQAASILDMKKTEVKYNNKWLDKLNFKDIVEIAGKFTVQQMLERDMFENRMKEGKPIGLHEFLYPLMQGYDCVAMKVDGEIGGNDQTFNMLAGRTLMKSMSNKEKFVVTNKLLADTSGKKMGKSEGNMITLDDAAVDKFGKVMAWTDDMIVNGFELCTFEPASKVSEVEARLNKGENPRDLKLELAKAIVRIYHGEAEAEKAVDNFIKTFSQKQNPDDIEEFDLSGKTIIEALVEARVVQSNSEARRNIQQGGVKINDQVVEKIDTKVKSGDVIQKGKRHFIKIK
ncbi:tyrosine--tRNA ligase [Candidatus Falkowbacteria bacterium]|jgi:tyrosyl-tRNA synthetase|nr:tyrosine--tRNA ligase [Candidatus Falkowbacteria bacterium]MBT6573568.1 tyrosine--tRNA ligase [Candidatus Falkowbacteria bacterium]MBT7349031.1 tyrosine--tRNA ligase [Candidatus Falkowbacteria bacterium]MBT7500976.1 tyrosine--tRNA ligase [Candidatus Falkowbacteria bacterium]